jgi:uncharacterized protein (TIGR02147 family)
MHDALYDRTDWRSFVRLRLEHLGLLQRDLAQRAGLLPSTVSMQLNGRRPVDPQSVVALADALELDGEGRAWFEALVDLDSPSDRARRAAYATVRSRLQQRSSIDPDDDVAEVQGDWVANVIAELASCSGFRADPVWLAQQIVPVVSELQARDALNALLRVGVLVPREDGGWDVASVRTGSVLLDRSRAAPALRLRASVRDLAGRSRGHPNERHDGVTTMALSEARAELLLARLREVEQELVQLAVDDPGPRNRVFVLATQLFHASEYTDTE